MTEQPLRKYEIIISIDELKIWNKFVVFVPSMNYAMACACKRAKQYKNWEDLCISLYTTQTDERDTYLKHIIMGDEYDWHHPRNWMRLK